jgi:hypothetical protein
VDSETLVRSLLALSGVAPPEDEVAEYIANYPKTRAAMDALYAVEGHAGTDGILVFRTP